jgi:transposase
MQRQQVTGPWSSDEIVTLKQEAERGNGYIKRVARKLGRSEKSVVKKAGKLRRVAHPDAPPIMPHSGNPARWTGTELYRLRQVAASGATTREAAQIFGLTKNSMMATAHRLGVRFSPPDSTRKASVVQNGEVVTPWAWRAWTAYEVGELRDGVARGESYAAIAERLGRPYGGLVAKARKMGLQQAGGRWSHADELRLRAFIEQGLSVAAIAARLGRTRGAIYHRKASILNGGELMHDTNLNERIADQAAVMIRCQEHYARTGDFTAQRDYLASVRMLKALLDRRAGKPEGE